MQSQDQPTPAPGSAAPADFPLVRDVVAGPAGPVRIEVRLIPQTQLMVAGPGIPAVRVDRVETAAERARREKAEAKAAAKAKPGSPAGSVRSRPKTALSVPDLFPRRREAVALTVGGAPAGLTPRRVLMVRATYGVRAQVSGRRYLLSQVWLRSARVRRDGQTVARLRRPSSYSKGPRYGDDVTWAPDADPVDVAMTHALASAYRVGSPGFASNLVLIFVYLLSMY